MLQKPRGTRDFLPDEMEARRDVEWRLREIARRFGYREVCTPEFEDLELFTMRSGEGIIDEMYVFLDKGGRKLALRPEITAAVMRMYVNEAKVAPKPLRWCYFADCFRYERPQKGRYRQFWQFGVELIGADTALADAEVVSLAAEMLNVTGVAYELKVGHLSFMKSLLKEIEPANQRRIMAYLDKRDFDGLQCSLDTLISPDLAESLQALVDCHNLPEAFEIVGPIPERSRIEQTFSLLDISGVAYTLNFGIARGLDYYTGLVFEGFAQNLGAENQILGGGCTGLLTLWEETTWHPAGLQSGSIGLWSHSVTTPVSKKRRSWELSARWKGENGQLRLRVHSGLQESGQKWIFSNAGLGPRLRTLPKLPLLSL